MGVVGYEATPGWERVWVSMTVTTRPKPQGPPPVSGNDGFKFHRIHERRWQRNVVARSTKAAAVSYPRARYPFMQSRLLHGFSSVVGENLLWMLYLVRGVTFNGQSVSNHSLFALI